MDEPRCRFYFAPNLWTRRDLRLVEMLSYSMLNAYCSNCQAAIDCRALNALIGALQTNNHGWRVTSDRNHIKWMSREQAPPEFLKCLSSKCKKTHYSTNQCSCRFNDILCTELCSRTGCQNVAETLAEYKLDNNCSDDDDEDINI